MTEQKHTPEPWLATGRVVYKLNEKGVNHFSAFVQDYQACESELEANARRIVACVNACAGMPTWKLERDGLPSVREYLDMEAQRDQLRAALESIVDQHKIPSIGASEWLREYVRAALAATEGN